MRGAQSWSKTSPDRRSDLHKHWRSCDCHWGPTQCHHCFQPGAEEDGKEQHTRVAFRKCTAHLSTLYSILYLSAVNQGPRCHGAHHYPKRRTGNRRGKARKALQDGRAAFRLISMCREGGFVTKNINEKCLGNYKGMRWGNGLQTHVSNRLWENISIQRHAASAPALSEKYQFGFFLFCLPFAW